MKKFVLLTLLFTLLASCLPEAPESTSSDGSDDGSTGGGTTTVVDTSGNDDGTSNDDDGSTGNQLPIAVYNVFLAGGQTWLPRSNTEPLTDTFLSPQEASIAFQTDGLLRARITVKPQQIAPVNDTYCFGRSTGVAFFPLYTQLKFDVSLVDITCPGGGTSCDPSSYIVGNPYRTQFGVGPVNSESSTEIIDLGQFANQGVVATALQISNVRSDQFCASNGSFCPAERMVRTQDCFNMEVQVQTSFTESL